MKNPAHKHGSYVCALTHSAARHVSSKKETHEVVICVFTQVWVSVFRCICTFYMPFFHHSWTRTHTHTPFTLKPVAVLTHTFPGVVLARGESSNGLEQACFLVRVKFWPGLKAAAIRSLPRCLWSGTRLNLHLLGELHFRYIVQASLNIAEGRRDIMLKSTPQDQAALCTGLWGWPPFLDHVEWRWSAVTHVVSHMDREVWGMLSFHLSGHIWALLL